MLRFVQCPMRGIALLLILILFIPWSCQNNAPNGSPEKEISKSDSLAVVNMIAVREQAMVNKDIDAAMGQFSEDATWINSQGYYFEGKDNVSKFHSMLAGNDTLDYYYEAGKPRIRIINSKNALAYYSWKMFWYKKEMPSDTTFKEIGLMSLTAHKYPHGWKWVAVTNQHTPWFYNDIEPVSTN